VLEPLLASFAKAYPEVEVEIVASGELADLATGGFDAGIRMGQFIAPDMIALRLAPPFPMIVVGSPTYLSTHAAPRSPEDLPNHACLRMRRSSGAVALWTLKAGNRTVDVAVNGPLIANNFPTLMGAALKGIGLAQVPRPIAETSLKDKTLIEVLGSYAPTAPGVFLYYPNRNQILPKLRAFVDHAKRALAARNRRATAPATRETRRNET